VIRRHLLVAVRTNVTRLNPCRPAAVRIDSDRTVFNHQPATDRLTQTDRQADRRTAIHQQVRQRYVTLYVIRRSITLHFRLPFYDVTRDKDGRDIFPCTLFVGLSDRRPSLYFSLCCKTYSVDRAVSKFTSELQTVSQLGVVLGYRSNYVNHHRHHRHLIVCPMHCTAALDRI